MAVAIGAIAAFIAVFAVATLRNVHLGVLMLPAAVAAGVALVGIPLDDVLGGFPVNLLVLLVGVTFFFGIAHVNGTVDRLVGRALARVASRPLAIPAVFFGLSGVIASMGSPLGGLVLAPVGMAIAKRAAVDPVLMGVAITSGIGAGGFAPTSLFGIVTYGTAHEAGIALNPLTLFGIAVAANLAVLIVASLTRRRDPPQGAQITAPASDAPIPAATLRFARHHIATLVCIVGLVVSVVAGALAGLDPDVGVLALALGAILALLDPPSGKLAVAKIDWSTVLLVGGVITFVGVLQRAGSVDMLADVATHVGAPAVAALAICLVGALVSAFASTTGILAALVPLAVPLATSGEVAGWALICALGVCASLVDISPFSTTGATLVASAAEEDRSRVRSLLLRFGMSLIVVGPLMLVALLVIPSSG